MQPWLDGSLIDRTPRVVRWFGLAALGVVFAALVLATIPPWVQYFASGFGEHWDTRLMGQWMSWNANNILNGQVWLPDFNANFFYPHANTLAFSESLWPQSFVYALIYAPTANPFLSFNGTMLVFWALSGIVMYALVKELGAGRVCAFLAGVIYCLMPYRLVYYIEFNMSLTFCVPLLWLAYVRWIKQPSMLRSIGFVVAFWIALTSTIYYTIIAGLVLCLIHVVDLIRRPGLLRNRDYWRWGIVTAVLCVGLGFLFLQPYIELRMAGNYSRDHDDFVRHYLQASHYIYPASSNVDYSIFGIPFGLPELRTAEVIAFPGSVLAALSLLFMVNAALHGLNDFYNGRVIRGLVKTAKLFLWTALWLIVVASWLWRHPNEAVVSTDVTFWICVGILIVTLVLCIWRDTTGDYRLVDFGAGAVLCFFISMGTDITVGYDHGQAILAKSPLGWVFGTVPVFEAVRGLSRFSIVVLTFLTIAGCITLHRLSANYRMTLWMVPVFVGLLVYEGRQNFYKFIDDVDQLADPAVQRLNTLPNDIPVAQIPIGPRWYDAQASMLTINDYRPLINGHSGFSPDYYLEWSAMLREWDIERLSTHFKSIWPHPWLIVDRRAVEKLGTGWRRPFPTQDLEEHWQLVEQGELYALYEPRPEVHSESTVTKWLRRDVLAANSTIEFEARAGTTGTIDARITISLNDVSLDEVQLSKQWQTYQVALDLAAGGELTGDRVSLQRTAGDDWQVRNVSFKPADTGAQ